ncbi:unnamed protein product [Gongylonema pulchrum]|uniref:Transmembrane protein n=1 Tax=Gongylonema pulchrum TaxID=637853 RepID=A0A183F0H7_9BILA|nr:unnamed protein product [Gongylonema pulchrum]
MAAQFARKRRTSKLEREEVEGSVEDASKRRGNIAAAIGERRQEDAIVSPVPFSAVVIFLSFFWLKLVPLLLKDQPRKAVSMDNDACFKHQMSQIFTFWFRLRHVVQEL